MVQSQILHDEMTNFHNAMVPGKGTPTANTPTTDMYGIGLGNASKLVSFATEEGSVNLPCYVQETFYTPSVEALQIITHTEDTRRLPHPLRYYR